MDFLPNSRKALISRLKLFNPVVVSKKLNKIVLHDNLVFEF